MYVLSTLRYIFLGVSVFAPHAVGRRFAPRPGHTKDHHKNKIVQTSSLLGTHASWWEFDIATRLKCRVVCGTVYGGMQLKYLLGSIARVCYYIRVSDFYLVLHGIRCRKKHKQININLLHSHMIRICVCGYTTHLQL